MQASVRWNVVITLFLELFVCTKYGVMCNTGGGEQSCPAARQRCAGSAHAVSTGGRSPAQGAPHCSQTHTRYRSAYT